MLNNTTESIEREGHYLKGSLIIFHEEAIKAIESGERKEISLSYKCQLDPSPGTWNGEYYDAVQKNIVINHVAIGPQGWGRAEPDCAIRTDFSNSSFTTGIPMSETMRLDGVEKELTPSNNTQLAEWQSQVETLKGRLDAMDLELEKEKAARALSEDPKAIEIKVQNRLKLVEKCRRIVGDDIALDSQSDDELKLLGIKKFHPEIDLSNKDQSYIDGMFEALLATSSDRNDSLTKARQVIHHTDTKANLAYEKWLEQSAKLWTIPLTGSMR